MLLNIEKLKVEARGEEGWTPILHGIDLQVARGEVVGLIGESGVGKSTLGLAALGFAQGGLRFAGGRVIFDGTDLLQLPERRRRAFRGRRVAYVAQSAAASFNPAWRLLDQFCEGPAIHHTADRAESEAFARRLYAAMAEELAPFGLAAHDIKIILHQVDRQNWGLRGLPGSEIELGFKVDV